MPRKSTRRRRFGSIVERICAGGRRAYHARWRERLRGPCKERRFATEEEAKDFLDEVESRLRLGIYETPKTSREVAAEAAIAVEPGLPLFVTYAKRLLDERLKPIKAEATGDLYQFNLDRLGEYFGSREVEGRKIPARRLDEITQGSFRDYRVWRLTQPRPAKDPERKHRVVGPTSVNREHAFASIVLNHAVADGLLLKNPLFGLKKLKEPRKPRRWLTKSEAATVIAKADAFFRPFVVTAIYSGCRPCELRNLKWGDVSIEGKRLSITRTKVGNADSLDMHPAVEVELKKLRKKYPDATAADHVFVNHRGKPWQDFRNAWELTLLAAKIEKRPGLSLYCLRHTFATHFLEGGGAVTDLRAQLGHSDLTTTARYADLVSERRKATVLAMDFAPPKKRKAKKRVVKKQPVAAESQPDTVSEPPAVYRVERKDRPLAAAS